MSLTGLPINKLTDEQFIEAYKEMKRKKPKGPTFFDVLKFAVQKEEITVARMMKLQTLAVDNNLA